MSVYHILPFKSRIHIGVASYWSTYSLWPIWCHSDLSVMRHDCSAVGMRHERSISTLFEQEFYWYYITVALLCGSVQKLLHRYKVINDGTAQRPTQHNLHWRFVSPHCRIVVHHQQTMNKCLDWAFWWVVTFHNFFNNTDHSFGCSVWELRVILRCVQ